MKVVLTEFVHNVGELGEVVNVKDGFGRNFLIPQGMAFELSSRNANVVRHKMLAIEAKKKKGKQEAQATADRMRGLVLEFPIRSTSAGKTFGSVSGREIAECLAANGYAVDRHSVELSAPLKALGDLDVAVRLHSEIKAVVKVRLIQAADTSSEQAPRIILEA